MSRTKSQKEELREEYSGRFAKASSAILAEYRGLSVAEITELRVELKKIDSEFRIANNRIVKKAIDAGLTDVEPIRDLLKGPIGIIFSYGDVAANAKTVLKFSGDHEKFKVKGGCTEGSALTVADLDALSKLPSKEVLLGQIVGTLVAPHRGLLGVLNGVTRNLVQVLNAIKDQKSE